MPSGFLDYEIQQNVFSTAELKQLFDEKARFRRWLTIEAALATAQAKAGTIPSQAAEEIRKKAHLECLDLSALKKGYETSRNSLIPVIAELRKACAAHFRDYVHYGATTQDIIDTGQVLEIKETLEIFFRDLRAIELRLLEITQAHRNTPMIGRTHGQQALPITLGLKVSLWMREIRRHIERIKSLYDRILIGQLSGAVGTMAAFGDKATFIKRETMKILNLQDDVGAWHTCRDNMAEMASFCSIMAGTMAKIANEIFQLGKTEFMELREPAPSGMSSSAMPHKRNPVLCQRLIVLSDHIRALCGVIHQSMVHENERDPRALWSEWLAIPQICIYSGTVLQYGLSVLRGLEVNPTMMLKNLQQYGEYCVSEYFLFKLAPKIGKVRAQQKLHDLFSTAQVNASEISDAFRNDHELAEHLGEDELNMMRHPERYVGHAISIVTTNVAVIEDCRQNENATLNHREKER